MTQNTLKQTPLKHIFGKERGNGKMWVPSMLVAVQPQLWAEGPSLSLALPLHSLMMVAGKRLFGKNFTFSTNFMETRKSS